MTLDSVSEIPRHQVFVGQAEYQPKSPIISLWRAIDGSFISKQPAYFNGVKKPEEFGFFTNNNSFAQSPRREGSPHSLVDNNDMRVNGVPIFLDKNEVQSLLKDKKFHTASPPVIAELRLSLTNLTKLIEVHRNTYSGTFQLSEEALASHAKFLEGDSSGDKISGEAYISGLGKSTISSKVIKILRSNYEHLYVPQLNEDGTVNWETLKQLK